MTRKEGYLRPKHESVIPPGAVERGLDPLLLELDRRITITSPELTEAWKRVQVLKSALAEGLREHVYINGSIKHGDALTPLNDIDLGVVISNPTASLQRRHSPAKMMASTGIVIEAFAKHHYPEVSTSFEGQTRSVVVDFGDRGRPGQQDFTADVIVALDYPAGQGVLVPNLLTDRWDRSDPVRHTEMIRDANLSTKSTYNRVVRIAKYWNRKNAGPLSSWNIKALALGCLTEPSSITMGLYRFFHYARDSLTLGPTEDPAGIASPIRLELPEREVLLHLGDMCDVIDGAIASTESGDIADAYGILEAAFGAFSVRV